MGKPLTWALVIATYNRGPALRRCIGLAVGQSRPPREIIVVDASANWQETRDLILQEVASKHPEIRWEFQEAVVRSSTSQRNQALALATSDVLFLIDDDSFMYPDCAEEVMKVYEADPNGAVAGVGAMRSDDPPETALAGGRSTAAAITGKPPTWLDQLLYSLHRLLWVESLLLPYDRAYPRHRLPAEVEALAAIPIRYLDGMRMTFRRAPIQQERFDEMLQRYAACEDLDASYRVSRHGALVDATRAWLYHAKDPSARLSRFTVTVLSLMNQAVLYRLKGYNPRAILRTFGMRVLCHKLPVDVIRDLGKRRLTLPTIRADAYSLAMLGELLSRDEAHLRQWYPSFQRRLIDRHPR